MPTITGDGAANVLVGTDDADVISGLGGADTISGGEGNDVIYGHSAGASGAITATAVSAGMAAPVAGAAAPGDPGFLYIVEKNSGIIWRVDVDTGARTQFLDIPNTEFLSNGERGVLGLAFHPDYAENGRFFVFLTDAEGDLQVREYQRNEGAPPTADADFSIVIEIPKQTGFSNHNGGWIGFSPVDGYLYITTGDGGGGGDPNNFSQNLDVLLGKLLRIDVNGDDFPADPNRNYAIPDDNPFVGVAGADEIWAYGLRNPWRIAFDPRNGDLYIADVGQNAREEVDFLPFGLAGANFGWRIMEGSLPYNPGPPGTPQPGDPSLILPVFEYDRSIGASITGGEVYLGPAQGFVGQYVFADFISGRLFSLAVVDGVAVDAIDRTPQLVGAALGSIVDFVTDSNGNLYAIGIGGAIWRLDFGLGAEDVGDILDGGAGNDIIEAGAGADRLDGGSGDDMLNGGIGADTMIGGAGDDTYVVDNAGDVVIESAGGGADLVQSSITFGLTANVENLTLTGAGAITGYGNVLDNVITGNGAANSLYGFDGNDTLNGMAGADAMFGGNGDDTYYVDNAGDLTTEVSASGGVDTVISSVNRNLTAHIENLILTGSADLTGAGNSLNNAITGNSGANTLYGFDGDDILDGGAGADVLFGAAGNDTYYVDHAGDITVEGISGAAGGVDTVISSIDRNLNANFENLTLTGSAQVGYGNVLNNILIGNGGANSLYGFDGHDYLDGGAGADLMFGGNGNDIYIVDNAGDVTAEVSADGGVDLVASSVTRNLTAHLENLNLIGAAAIDGAGNSLNNVINGNIAANTLYGLEGDDTLDGGLGADTLQGGPGADTYVFSSALGPGNIDTIVGFNVADDTIRLVNTVFTDLSNGTLAASAFHIGAAAADADDRIIYDSATGALYYDPDGVGAAAAIQFATLAAGLALTNADFIVGGP